jgi:glycogen(starch) synthase
MRIVLIVEAFRSLGGAQEVVDNLAEEFVRLGQTVAIVSTPYIGPGCERVPRTHVECTYLEIDGYKPISWRHLERLIRRPNGAQLVDCLQRLRPDVVNSHVWDWDKFPAVADACRAAGVPLVQTLNDSWGRGKLGDDALGALQYASALVAISVATKRDFEARTAAACDAHVIPGGVDCEAAQVAAPYLRPRPYIFCAARLDFRHKAVDILVRAFSALAAEHPEVDLLIAGDGPDRLKLEQIVAEAGLGRRVELLGMRRRDELWSLYKGALLFVLPSGAPEGLGLVFLEAMASGTPVIATGSGGCTEIVLDGENGLLIERNDPDVLAQAIRKLLDDPELRGKMAHCGREIAVTQYGWRQSARRYLDVYASCIGTPSKATAPKPHPSRD